MKRVEYLVCPLCGLNRVLKSYKREWKGKREAATFDKGRLPSLKNMNIIQIREGGGKKPGASGKKGRGRAPGSGFRLVGGLTLPEMMQRAEYADILSDLKAQFITLLRESLEIGFITPEDYEEPR